MIEITERNLTNEENQAFNTRIALSEELHNLKKWFKEYDRIAIEHGRCQRLGIESHHNIAELDNLALVNSLRIKEIEKTLQFN